MEQVVLQCLDLFRGHGLFVFEHGFEEGCGGCLVDEIEVEPATVGALAFEGNGAGSIGFEAPIDDAIPVFQGGDASVREFAQADNRGVREARGHRDDTEVLAEEIGVFRFLQDGAFKRIHVGVFDEGLFTEDGIVVTRRNLCADFVRDTAVRGRVEVILVKDKLDGLADALDVASVSRAVIPRCEEFPLVVDFDVLAEELGHIVSGHAGDEEI